MTATKREATAQSIPVAVSAISETQLEQLGINDFSDYLQALPGVTAGGAGPGQATIYIRGQASTTPNLTVAAAAGIAPNVALYLDEQPLVQVGRNLDVYVTDISRVEVLPGPQGTLFGASSQAGTVRLITNKPDLNDYSARLAGGASLTENGDPSANIEVVVNAPIIENKLAVRGVFYQDRQGGFIDNVFGERDVSESARFLSGGELRPNGVPVDPGLQAGADLSDVEFLTLDNSDLVEEDFNDVDFRGGRISALWAINEDWDVLVSHQRQRIQSEGVFFFDPELDDPEQLSIQRFSEDSAEDRFSNTTWTVNGRIKALDVVYTGSFLDRETDQTVDYADYLFVGQYLPYYICDASVTYPGDAAPSGTCQAPELFVDLETDTTTFTHELRFTTPEDLPFRSTFGAFYSDQELVEVGEFIYTGSLFVESFTPGVFGFAPNGPLPGSSVSDPSVRPPGVVFFNDITRTDRQIGAFGEFTAEVWPDTLELTFGVRWFDVDVDLVGSANSSFGNLGGPDIDIFGSNLDVVLEDFRPAEAQGFIFKANASWTPTPDTLFYFTFSEGFRPGLLNRAGGAGGVVPFAVDTDEVVNFEIGWKTRFFDNALQFNGSAFLVNIDDLQTTIFDATVTNLFFADNAANAQIMGIEGDAIWAPSQLPGLTLAAAFSILDTEITEIVGASTIAVAPVGSELSFAPNFQGNLRARYEWTALNGMDFHVQSTASYSGSSFSDIVLINRAEQDDYTLFGLSGGVAKDNWTFSLFGENLLDTRAQLFNSLIFDVERIATNRPRTWGFRASVDF
ncbi:MAG: TonB-dependent receptor [Maricaulaceae bacterium]